MRASRLCISRIWVTPVKPASRSPSSRIAARIGLSSTMTILGAVSPIDHSHSGKTSLSTPEAGSKPCIYEQLGLAPAHQSDTLKYESGRRAQSQLCLLGVPQGAGGFR